MQRHSLPSVPIDAIKGDIIVSVRERAMGPAGKSGIVQTGKLSQ